LKKYILKGVIILNRGSSILFLKFLSYCFANLVFFWDLSQVKDSMHKFRIFIVMFSFFGWIQNLVRTLPSVLFGTRGLFKKMPGILSKFSKHFPFCRVLEKGTRQIAEYKTNFSFPVVCSTMWMPQHCVQCKFFCN
jgi:hypothetical protein